MEGIWRVYGGYIVGMELRGVNAIDLSYTVVCC